MKIAVVGPCDLAPFTDLLLGSHTIPNHYSFPYISELVQAYYAAGHQVEVVTSSEEVTRTERWEGSSGFGVTVVPRRSRAKDRALDFFSQESKAVENAVREARPDVIHAHWIYEFARGALAVQRDALVTAHDAPLSVLRHYGRHPYWWFREAVGISTLLRVKNLTVVSPSLEKELRAFLPSTARVDVVPNGIASGAACQADSRKSVRNLQRPVFATVSNGFDRRKNTSMALKAFARVRHQLPDSIIHMYGHGHEIDGEANKWAKDNKIEHNVVFRGPLPHAKMIDELASTADIIVHPSRWEACSLALLEARSLGLPIIACSRAGGVGYTLDNGASGYLVRQNVNSYARAMLDLTLRPSIYGSISSNSVANLSPEFDLQRVSNAYLSRFDDILRARHQ